MQRIIFHDLRAIKAHIFYVFYSFLSRAISPAPLRRTGHAGVRPIRHNAKPQFCASTTVSLNYVWHGSLLSRSFIACNLCVEVIVVCSAFSCECDCCSWVLVSISCNHILDVTPPYNSGFLKWNHMIFNELKNW